MGADQHFDWTASTVSALDWWREAGVDVAIAEQPRDWLAPPTPPPSTPAMPGAIYLRAEAAPVAAPPVVRPMPDTLAAFSAWRLGPDAPDAGWAGAPLWTEGPAAAPIMVVIEMPEREDSAAGTLMSGMVGQLFSRMLAAIGLDRPMVQLVPMCIKRPSTGRIPAETEPALADALNHYVALAAPKRLLLFGNAVSRALLGADIAEKRGALRLVNQKDGQAGEAIHAVASFHPRFLLERPAAKAEAWKDLLLLIQGIDA